MGVKGVVVSLQLLFAVIVLAMVVSSIIPPLHGEVNTQAVEEEGYSGQMDLVRTAAVVFVPLILGVGVIIYGFALTQREESFFGGGRPPR